MLFDARAFDPAAIDPETEQLNAAILAKLAEAPDPWSLPITLVRERRRQGLGPFPMMPRSARAEILMIDGPGGPLELRVIAPSGAARGVYLHLHGGGWTWGAADEQDSSLERIADRCGYACVSVEYRLSPEHPYPAAPDDAEAAALWLMRHTRERFGTERLAIGGESAGAHLALVTLLRLRDRHGVTPFRGANLFAGCFDLSLTPSVRNWGPEKLVLNTRDVQMFADQFCGPGLDRRSHDVSPLYASLVDLPPALISVGTRDPLLDDSLFLAARWQAAGSPVETALWPGACHVFAFFPSALGERALARIDAFLQDLSA